MKNTLATIGGYLFGAVFLFLWGKGCIHSENKHPNDYDWQRYSPYAVYRGVESFYHKDKDKFADVDWDKRLTLDMRSIVYFLNEGSSKEGNIYEVNENIEEFSGKIKNYPIDKKTFLKKGTRRYIEYSTISTNEAISKMMNYYETGVYNPEFSDSAKVLERELENTYKLKEVVEAFHTGMTNVSNVLNKEEKVSVNKIEEMKTLLMGKMNEEVPAAIRKLKSIYKDIFSEEY